MGTGKKPSTLTIIYAAKALIQLDEIWSWNEEHYGANHADQYVGFLERQIDALGAAHQRGKQVGSRPDWNYILIRRKSKGHGHIAVYSVNENQLEVLYMFHSAQNWQAKLMEEKE